MNTVSTMPGAILSDVDCQRRVWVKWSHPDTLPNPSLESADDLESVEPSEGADGAA